MASSSAVSGCHLFVRVAGIPRPVAVLVYPPTDSEAQDDGIHVSLSEFQDAFWAAVEALNMPSDGDQPAGLDRNNRRVRFVFRGTELRVTSPSRTLLSQIAPALRPGDHLHAILVEAQPPTVLTAAATRGTLEEVRRFLTQISRQPGQGGPNAAPVVVGPHQRVVRLVDPPPVPAPGSTVFSSRGAASTSTLRPSLYLEHPELATTQPRTIEARTNWMRSEPSEVADLLRQDISFFTVHMRTILVGVLIGFFLGPISVLFLAAEQRVGLGHDMKKHDGLYHPNRMVTGLKEYRWPLQVGVGIGLCCHLILALFTPGQALSSY